MSAPSMPGAHVASARHRWGALFDLLGRYRRVFTQAWARRDDSKAGRFNRQEAEFLPAALALQERPASTTLRWTARLLMALVGSALSWSWFGHMDIVVNAHGRIIPSGRTKTISSVEVAAVRALHVQEGQAVRAGDLLVELDTSAADSEHDKAQGDHELALLQMARSEALIAAIDSGKPARLPRHVDGLDNFTPTQWRAAQQVLGDQHRDFLARLARLEASIALAAQALPIATRTAADYQLLAAQHDVSTHAWLDKEQARLQLQGQLTDAQRQRDALVTQARKEARDAYLEARRVAGETRQDARRAGARSHLLMLRSPVDGTVQQLNVHTVGGVVPAAQPLMLVVPRQEEVEIEAVLENRDVGFVQVDQAARVKVEAYEYTRYGTLEARVVQVSRDAVQDEKKGPVYAVRIRLARPFIDVDGQAMPLSPGLSVDAEIRTGTRRVIEYVLSPLLQHAHEALHER